MLYYLSKYLIAAWGPFRLLQSHLLLLSAGAVLAAFATLIALPRVWGLLPRDHGKAIIGKEGMKSAGKPTGAGIAITLAALPAVALFAPLGIWDALAILSMYAAMLFGYLDDRAEVPWGQLKKGLLDAVVSLAVASFVYLSQSGDGGVTVWFPFVKGVVLAPACAYIPCAAFIVWFTLNATNCSDGVDALAGTLTLMTLATLAAILYLVVGYRPVADYLLVPCVKGGAQWAIVVMIFAGAFGGYLWHNAEPSKVLMGDAGSRFLGTLVATAALVAGNPFLVFALSPVVLLNGGGGLAKLVLLRLAKRLRMDVSENAAIRRIRFPLHDHCRKNLGWSNSQVLLRFVLVQVAAMSALLMLFVKIR